jgi:hypothetical protein
VFFDVATPGGSLTLCQHCLAQAMGGRRLFAEDEHGPPLAAVDLHKLKQRNQQEQSVCLSCDPLPSNPSESSEDNPDA